MCRPAASELAPSPFSAWAGWGGSARERTERGGACILSAAYNLRFRPAQVVLFDPAYLPTAGAAQRPLPAFRPQLHFNFPWPGVHGNPDIYASPLAVPASRCRCRACCSSRGWFPLLCVPVQQAATPHGTALLLRAQADNQTRLPPLAIRPASSREPSPDLQRPAFDASITPLLLFAEWQENYSHTLSNSAAWLRSRLKLSPGLAARAALVLATPLGLAVPRHWQALVGPFVPARPIQSFADFSARLPQQPDGCFGGGEVGSFSAAAASRSRCFQEMLVCEASPMHEAFNISQVGSCWRAGRGEARVTRMARRTAGRVRASRVACLPASLETS